MSDYLKWHRRQEWADRVVAVLVVVNVILWSLWIFAPDVLAKVLP